MIEPSLVSSTHGYILPGIQLRRTAAAVQSAVHMLQHRQFTIWGCLSAILDMQ